MTKNKDPMLKELGSVINNRTVTQKARVPFSEHAADLINGTIDLIEKVLIKHSAAVLEEMHDQIVARNEEIKHLQIALRIKTEEHNCCAEDLMLILGGRPIKEDVMTLEELKLHADMHQDAGNMDEMRVALHAIGLRRTVENLAALLRRLVRATKHKNDTSVLVRQIETYLKENDLNGSNNILRAINLEGSEEDCPKPAPGFKLDARGVLVADDSTISRLATENGHFRLLIEEAIAAMDHAEVFLCSREKMNDIGRVQWTELLNRMAAAIEGLENR